MRNKLINHLLLFSNVLFILGLAITIILINNKGQSGYLLDLNSIILYYVPFIVLMILSMIIAGLFFKFRFEYFVMIKIHLNPKTIKLYKASILMLFFNIFVAMVMMFSILFTNLDDPATLNFFKNIYLYIVLGIEMFLTMVDVALDAIAKLRIKVDLANRRSGLEGFLGEKSHE